MKTIWKLMLAALLLPGTALAEEPKKQQPKGPPPMLVAVAPVESGTAQPMQELVGSVRYVRISRVAAELGGIVEKIDFEDGQRVKSGQPLVKLRSDLLEARIEGTRASYEQVLVELEQARKDLKRIDALFRQDAIAEVVFDQNHYGVLGLEKRAAALKANLDRQLLERKKSSILSPFSGLVLSKNTELGEWVADGGQVALIADDSEVDVVVDVPQQLLPYLQSGRSIAITAAGRELEGRFVHFVPRGDVATRTFSVKLRLDNTAALVEGMAASALLPSGENQSGLLLPRDAVIRLYGQDTAFVVLDGKAKMIPVRITGYQGMKVGVTGEGLEAGQQVVIKGNERIRDGQAVRLEQQ